MKRETLSSCMLIALVITPSAAHISITVDDYQKIAGRHAQVTIK